MPDTHPTAPMATVLPFPTRQVSRVGVEEFCFFARYAVGLVVRDRDHGRQVPAEVDQALGVLLDWLVIADDA